jgi:hypothetical protein
VTVREREGVEVDGTNVRRVETLLKSTCVEVTRCVGKKIHAGRETTNAERVDELYTALSGDHPRKP